MVAFRSQRDIEEEYRSSIVAQYFEGHVLLVYIGYFKKQADEALTLQVPEGHLLLVSMTSLKQHI